MTTSTAVDEGTLANILSQCLSPDPNLRMNAELYLKQAATSSQFPVALLHLVFVSGHQQGIRQMAAVTLKNYIDSHWFPKSERFVGPEPSPETKQWVRQNILNGLSDSHTSIRVAIAHVVSKIAHGDWPEAWPSLFEELMVLLKSSNQNDTHGAMRVFAEFVKDDIADSQFPHVAPVLLPQLLFIFTNETAYPPRMRAKAVGILQDFIELIFMVKEVHPEVIDAYLKPILSEWMGPFKDTLEAPLSQETLCIRHEVLQAIVKLTKEFPKQMTPYIHPLLDLIYREFITLCNEYETSLVLPKPDEADLNDTEEIDSDGEILGTSSLVYSVMGLVRLIASKKAFKGFFASAASTKYPQTRYSNDDTVLSSLIRHLIVFSRVASTSESAWMNDIQQFIQDDEEDGLAFNVRVSAEETLQEILDNHHAEGLKSLLHIISQQVQEVMTSDAHVAPSWWKVPEACFYMMGQFQSEVMEAASSGPGVFDISGFFSNVVVQAAKTSGAPFLQGRALCVASQYGASLPMEIVVPCVETAVQLLQETSAILSLRISALKAIRGFLSHRAKTDFLTAQKSLLQALFGFTSIVQNMDVSQMLVETMTLVIAINPGSLGEYDTLMTDFVGNIWRLGENGKLNASETHMLFASLVTELVGTLAQNSSIALCMQTQLVPQWTESLSVGDHASSLVTIALDLLTKFMKKSSVSIPPTHAPRLYEEIFKLLLGSQESGILQSGQDLIKVLVEKDFATLAQWNQNGRTGLEYLLDFVAKLLHPSQSESSAVFVGDLIIKVILKAGPLLNPVLPNLLQAVIERLGSAKMPSFIQTLLMVFARLMVDQFDTVLGFLKSVKVQERNGLDLFLNAWCDNYVYLQGSYFIKLSVVNLTRLFESQDPDLERIQVKGDLVVQQTKRIVTRSMAKDHPDQYTIVAFPVKVLKLLVNEYQNQLESAMKSSGRGMQGQSTWMEEETLDDDDDDGEWEDTNDDDEDELTNLVNELGDEISFEDDEAEEDEEWQNDPIHQFDVKAHIAAFFKGGLSKNVGHMQEIVQHMLNDKEKQILLSIAQTGV